MLNNVASHASQLSLTPRTALFQAILAAEQSKQEKDETESSLTFLFSFLTLLSDWQAAVNITVHW